MKFFLEIECDNAAFEDVLAREVARILSGLASRIVSTHADMGEEFVLLDDNGNRVGKAQFKGDATGIDPAQEIRESGYEVRHNMLGYYICSLAEGQHEDDGNPSAGFDGRPHFESADDAYAAARQAMT